jgi:hypothetical protein
MDMVIVIGGDDRSRIAPPASFLLPGEVDEIV